MGWAAIAITTQIHPHVINKKVLLQENRLDPRLGNTHTMLEMCVLNKLTAMTAANKPPIVKNPGNGEDRLYY